MSSEIVRLVRTSSDRQQNGKYSLVRALRGSRTQAHLRLLDRQEQLRVQSGSRRHQEAVGGELTCNIYSYNIFCISGIRGAYVESKEYLDIRWDGKNHLH
jgi:hypothetical protein